MALLFMDGFDHYATADINKKWPGGYLGTCSIQASSGRRGTGCLRMGSSSSSPVRGVPAGSSFVVGAAFNFGGTLADYALIAFTDVAAVAQVGIGVHPDGSVFFWKGASITGVIGSPSAAGVVTTAAWAYIEVKVTIADSISADTCQIRVNGALVLNLPAGSDTKNSSTTDNATGVKLGLNQGGNYFDVDDMYVLDQTGSAPTNTFLGDCRVDSVLPNGDGTYSEFTPSTGTSHSALVDEATPNTTDYNASSTLNQRDTYAMANLAAVTGTIFGVQANVAVTKDDAGSRTVAPMLRSNGNDSVGPDLGLSTTQLYASGVWEKNPDGNVVWTETAVNALEAGVKVTG